MTSMNYIHCTPVRSQFIHGHNSITLARSKSNVEAKLTLKPCTPKLKQPSLVVFCSDSVVLVKSNPIASLTLLWMTTKVMEVVKGLDLKRYMGRWYEIACFPSRFQPSDGVNTRATYTLGDDGTVRVLNETWSGGKRSFIEGTAHKADPDSDEAKLKVRFWVPPFLPVIPVTGDYWVLFIDPDYQYALIGQPSWNYLWILSRKNEMDEEIYKELVKRAKDEGYDVSKLHKTPHTNPPPEREGPEDTKGVWWFKSLLGK